MIIYKYLFMLLGTILWMNSVTAAPDYKYHAVHCYAEFSGKVQEIEQNAQQAIDAVSSLIDNMNYTESEREGMDKQARETFKGNKEFQIQMIFQSFKKCINSLN